MHKNVMPCPASCTTLGGLQGRAWLHSLTHPQSHDGLLGFVRRYCNICMGFVKRATGKKCLSCIIIVMVFFSLPLTESSPRPVPEHRESTCLSDISETKCRLATAGADFSLWFFCGWGCCWIFCLLQRSCHLPINVAGF